MATLMPFQIPMATGSIGSPQPFAAAFPNPALSPPSNTAFQTAWNTTAQPHPQLGNINIGFQSAFDNATANPPHPQVGDKRRSASPCFSANKKSRVCAPDDEAPSPLPFSRKRSRSGDNSPTGSSLKRLASGVPQLARPAVPKRRARGTAIQGTAIQSLELDTEPVGHRAPHSSVKTIVAPLFGKPQTFDLDFAKLVAAHTPGREGGLQLSLRHQTPAEMCLQLAAQCLASRESMFVASLTGTIWRVLCKQSGLMPEILIEELPGSCSEQPTVEIEDLTSPTGACEGMDMDTN